MSIELCDALTYHSVVKHANDEGYIVLVKKQLQDLSETRATVYHLWCVVDDMHQDIANSLPNPLISVQYHERNPCWGTVPCFRCKLY